ncbi:MAG TPA: SusC/RagA family TonB-linked outer membrane protein, partial [Puia sp.]|nr:SusC/RagA family TonB-linked outer membrane protein [Puia sp.]
DLVSFLARVTDNIKDRYLLTLSFRDDGTSKFQPRNHWSMFPSGAFAWHVSNEPFLQSLIGTLSDAKLRVSYGRTGNQGVGPYMTLSKLIPYPYTFNGSLANGYADDYYAGPGNADLKWETTDQYDAGLDLGFLRNRVTFHGDIYYKRTHDLLQNITIPPTTGFGTQLVNRGEVANKGLELSVTAIPVTTKDFNWNLSANISFNRNKIVSLGGGVTEQFATRINTNGDQPFIQKVGQPIGALYGYVEQDIYRNEAEVRADPVMAGQPDAIIKRTVGEIRYKDLDHDGAITSKDQMLIGNVNPKFTYGFSNSFTWKDFDMNFMIQGVYGNDIINMNTYFLSNIGGFNNITQKMWNDRWTFTNWENAKSPKAEQQYWRAFKFTRRFIEDGSYIRLRNITVGYNLRPRTHFIQTVRIFATVNNLVTITKYSGYDPDINGYGDDPSRRGVDMGGYPSSKVYNLGVQCTF